MLQCIRVAIAALAASCAMYGHGAMIYDAGPLDFNSTDQSMWGSGAAFSKQESVFVGAEWNNKTATIGGIAGSANATVIPAIGAVTVPVYEPRIFVPTPTWSNPFKGYNTGCGCWKDVQVTPAIPAVTADTRTGAKLDVHTSGKVGMEFGYSVNSGKVDTSASFSAKAQLPDAVSKAQFVSLNPTSNFDNGTIQTESPWVEAYISGIMQLSGSIDAKACALTFGCAEGSTALPTVDLDQRILSIDPNSLKVLDGIGPGGQPFAEVAIANQSLTLEGAATATPPAVGFKLTGPLGVTLASSIPPGPSVGADVAEATVYAPQIDTDGTGSGDKVASSGRDDLLSAQLDLDGAATLMGGLPPAGLNFDLIDAGAFKLGASLDLIDVDAGPVLGITQDFEFTPSLMTTIQFSNPVQIAGLPGTHTSWTGLWSELPAIALAATTTLTPTFWLDALLRNDLGLDLGLVGTLDLLKLGATGIIGGFDVLSFNPISLNNLLGISNELFSSPKVGFSVFDNSFSLGGFNTVAGSPLTLLVQVPAPGALMLLALGIGGLALRRRRLHAAARVV